MPTNAKRRRQDKKPLSGNAAANAKRRRSLKSVLPKVAQRVLDDIDYRRKVSVSSSLAIDALWAVANLVAGVYLASVWSITLGAYYLLLCAMRSAVLHRLSRTSHTSNANDEQGLRSLKDAERRSNARIERLCGALLLLSTFVLSGIVVLVMKGKGSFVYEGVLIYAVATFAFYSLTIAIVNYVRLRRHNDALVVLNCRINLAVALVSIFALEVAMLAEFGTSDDVTLSYVMPIITGAAIAAALVIMGMRSIMKAGKAKEAPSARGKAR